MIHFSAVIRVLFTFQTHILLAKVSLNPLPPLTILPRDLCRAREREIKSSHRLLTGSRVRSRTEREEDSFGHILPENVNVWNVMR